MKDYEEIDMPTAIMAFHKQEVFMIFQLTGMTTVNDLQTAEGFLVKKNSVKKAPKKVDTGKIKALYDAHWPVTKIADEMKLAPSTISYHLKKIYGEDKEDGRGKEPGKQSEEILP